MILREAYQKSKKKGYKKLLKGLRPVSGNFTSVSVNPSAPV